MPHHTTYVRFQSVSLKRLAADIEDFETDFARYRVGAAKDDNTWVESCSAHLANAKEALAECDANLGYQYLGNAERDAVPLMPEDERRARADSLRTELKYKLDNWRRKAASLLCPLRD